MLKLKTHSVFHDLFLKYLSVEILLTRECTYFDMILIRILNLDISKHER